MLTIMLNISWSMEMLLVSPIITVVLEFCFFLILCKIIGCVLQDADWKLMNINAIFHALSF